MFSLKSFAKYTLLILSVCFFTLSSFVGYETEGEVPGRIAFIGDAGSPNVFIFKKWEITSSSVPNDDVEQIQVQVDINTSSIQTDWKDLEKSIRKKTDYFYVKKFPTATVAINGAQRQEDGSYITNAQLTLKGITKEVPLQFTISEEKPYKVQGSGIVERRTFQFTGDGPKDEVPVNFELTLPE